MIVLAKLIHFLKAQRRKKWLKKMEHFYQKSDSAIFLDSFDLRLDLPTNKKYLQVGENSAVGGSFIFESKDGFVSIGKNCWIGSSSFICNAKIIIEDNVTIAFNSNFYTHNSHSLNYLERQRDISEHIGAIKNKRNPFAIKNWNDVGSKPIRICKNAWIGMNCLILKGVTIGEGAIVGAGSVVAKDVEPWTVVAGNPAKVVKRLK
jgi:galactoside O-acetyltransferase